MLSPHGWTIDFFPLVSVLDDDTIAVLHSLSP
jgi:hypothetical protein